MACVRDKDKGDFDLAKFTAIELYSSLLHLLIVESISVFLLIWLLREMRSRFFAVDDSV